MTDTYIHGHDESVLASHRWRGAENSAGYLLPVLQENHTLLDVGCGPGTITRDFAQRLPRGRVVALDRSAPIVREAVGAIQHCSGIVGDAYTLPFPNRSFDVVHAHQVLQHLRDPEGAIGEMARVSRHYLAFADADYDRMMWWPNVQELDRWMQLYQGIASANHVNPNIGRQLPSLALACGLSRYTTHAITWTYATPELCRWWGDLWAGRVLHSTFASEALRLGLSTHEELAFIARGWKAWARQPGAMFVIPSVAILAEN
ncbi:methyltransferase domain-containing protein [Ferrimicrobium sp.]|uniref:methyltransferase domain-containing protein n=1 Tax=Ferrimicrobium sp. TaxID=2926050 RepID=UPI00261E907D|nr:methyltransferase domain-containing protein [Ferrimicrobium sp.]